MNIIKKSEATYILVINISEDLKIRVGQLGEAFFKEGDYIYIGSAKDSLDVRLRRHLRKGKKTYWHIDYLLRSEKIKILQIWTIDKKVECQTTEVFCQDPAIKIIKKGFGSSDCRCLTHLFFVKDKKKTEKILKKIGFSVYYSFSKFKIDNPLL